MTRLTDTHVAYLADIRAVHEKVDITNGLEIIRQLQPKKYKKTDYINYAGNYKIVNNRWDWEVGLIAQEVKNIPDLCCFVKGGDTYENDVLVENGNYLQYNDIHTYNISATKELDTIVQQQQTRIQELETENAIIKNALNELLSNAGKPTI